MKHRPILISGIIAFFALSLLTLRANAYSDFIGIFARIDKVVFEPASGSPERIQIWGAFALAGSEGGSFYKPAERGYLYFSVKAGKEDVCRKEWADLKSIAGTDQIIGFGMRYQPVRLRKAADKPADPDVYPVGFGLHKMSERGTEYAPIRDLRSLPKEQ
jgi:hypothetical protein